jgi:hypothetical protein
MGAVSAETLTLRVQGHAKGTGADALKAAYQDAQYEAVASVLRSLVLSDDLHSLRSVLNRASDYIEHVKYLDISRVEDATHIEVEATVTQENLYRDACAQLLPLRSRPVTVLLLGVWQSGDEMVLEGADGPVSSVLHSAMEKAGMKVYGPKLIQSLKAGDERGRLLSGQSEHLRKVALAHRLDAVAIVSTEITVGNTAVPGNVMENRAKSTARIFRGRDGKMTEAFTTTSLVRGAEREISADQAARDSCTRLIEKTRTFLTVAALSSEELQGVLVTLAPPGAPDQFRLVIEVLESIEGLKAVETLLYTENIGRLLLDYNGPMRDLCLAIDHRVLDSVTLSVRQSVGRELTIAVQ